MIFYYKIIIFFLIYLLKNTIKLKSEVKFGKFKIFLFCKLKKFEFACLESVTQVNKLFLKNGI